MSLKNKNNGTTIFFIFLVSIALAIFLAPAGGAIHGYFWKGGGGCAFYIYLCDDNRVMEGFIYFYTFFISVFSFAFLTAKTAIKVFITSTILFWFYIILSLIDALKFQRKEYISILIIMGILSVLGYFIALGVNKTMEYFKNKRKNFEK